MLNEWEHYRDIRTLLKQVPKDAPTAATTFYTVPLSDHEILYDVRYSSTEHLLEAEYIILDTHDSASYTPYAINGKNGVENFADLLKENGYQQFAAIWDIVVYQKEKA